LIVEFQAKIDEGLIIEELEKGHFREGVFSVLGL
jgi:hypothetical protein